jgi:hypothetical protein
MSSILDALRKVEAEKAKKKVDLGEVEELLAERDLLVAGEEEAQDRASGRRRLIIAGAMIVLAVTAGVATFFIYGFVRGGPPEEVTESQALFSTPGQLPQVPAQATELAAEPQTASEMVASPQPTAPEPTVPAPPRAASAVRTPEPPLAEPPEAAAPEPLTPPAPTAAVAERASVAAPAQPPPERPKLKINILRPASDQFATALAVVNGKKVAIGDYVDGAKVIKIQSDGIVFEYGDDLFLVKF